MVTRQQRLDEFDGSGDPPAGEAIELLCEDHCGSYLVPFPCHWADGAWRSLKSGQAIEATIIGWRRPHTSGAAGGLSTTPSQRP